MRLAHATLYRRLLARDPLYDGRFFTGVLTTGIYCLPSCRARKPLARNVRFFPSCAAARSSGLRACRKCHPDDYEQGADPVQTIIETVVNEVRTAPAMFPDAAAVVERTGFGTTRAFELFRLHYQLTPAELLARARLAHAQTLLATSGESLTTIALACGFTSQSTFHAAFLARVGLTPHSYRELRAGAALRWSLALPPAFDVAAFQRSAGRDADSLCERTPAPSRFVAAVRLGGPPARLMLTFQREGRVEICIQKVDTQGGAALTGEEWSLVTARVRHLLGLDQDLADFHRLVRKLGCRRLVAGHETLRLALHWGPWEALVWAILGQQINLPFTFRLRRSLTELAGDDVGEGLRALPTPEAVVALEPAALRARQFSRQKIATLQRVARRVVDGELPLERMPNWSATRVARVLGEVPGLGPWTVNYVMMRGLGWPDCVPYRDTGVTHGLQQLHQLPQRPDEEETRRLLLPFSPHRSLATAHLWHLKS